MASSVLLVHIPAATARCRVVSSIGSPANNSSERASKHPQHSYTYDAMLGGTLKATAISSLVCTSRHWLSACGPLSSVPGHWRECPSPTAFGAAPAQRDSVSSANRSRPSAEGHRSSSLSRGRTSRSDPGTALRSDAPAETKVAMSERRMREGVEVVDSRDISNGVALPTSGKTPTRRSQAAGTTAVGRRGLPRPPTDAQRQRMADLAEMDEEPAQLGVAEVLENAVRTLKERLVAGVMLEEAESTEAVKSLYKRESLRKLRDTGVVLTDLRATRQSRLFGEAVWRLSPAQGKELPFNRFSQGDSVVVSTKKGGDGNGQASAMVEGTLLEASRSHVSVVFRADAADQFEDLGAEVLEWRVDQTQSSGTTKRQLEALESLAHMQRDSVAERRTRCVILGMPHSAKLANEKNSWAGNPLWRTDIGNAVLAVPNLNRSQKVAILSAVFSTFTLWQGPPGTGKTRTLLAMMKILADANRAPHRWKKFGTMLACAGTNAATDNLAEGLLAEGVRVVRLGQPAKVRAGLQQITLDALAERTPQGIQALELREYALRMADHATAAINTFTAARAAELRGDTPSFTDGSTGEGRAPAAEGGDGDPLTEDEAYDMRRLARSERLRAEQLLKDAYEYILDNAEVVAATCTGAGDSRLEGRIFRMVVIDEATQATEPSTLIPLVRGAECVVVAGDPLQLPPTVLSLRAASEFRLDQTLFDRMLGCGLEALLLDTQYRMHKGIAAFPSAAFYDKKLKTGVPSVDRPPPMGFPWPVAGLPVALVPCEGGSEQRSDSAQRTGISQSGSSYRNLPEAQLALRAMAALLSGADVTSAAILTPYNGQVRLLNELIRQAAPYFDGVEVCSVDGFQGREADVIVFSAVRCNDRANLGFVADPRRLNVAITRPRRGLVVVASPTTLAGGKEWKAWVQWVVERGAVLQPSDLAAQIPQRKAVAAMAP